MHSFFSVDGSAGEHQWRPLPVGRPTRHGVDCPLRFARLGEMQPKVLSTNMIRIGTMYTHLDDLHRPHRRLNVKRRAVGLDEPGEAANARLLSVRNDEDNRSVTIHSDRRDVGHLLIR